MSKRRLVILESPYSGDVALNVAYARAALKDCLDRGESPMASHLLYTQVLDDTVPDERTAGIEAGFAWAGVADATVVYTDLGISTGMTWGIRDAAWKRPVEYRQLPADVLARIEAQR